MKLTIHNRLEAIPPLAEKVAAYLGNARVSSESIMTTNLCLDELLTNTIQYGYSDSETQNQYRYAPGERGIEHRYRR